MRLPWSSLLVAACLAVACGGSSAPQAAVPSTPVPTPTPSPGNVLEARAVVLCDAALKAPAPTTAATAFRPVVLYWRRDESRVQPGSRSSTAGAGWHGEIYGDLPEPLRAATVEDVQAVVCRQENYIQVGTYERSNSAAVRIDWELRLVRWPSGELLAARTFRGADPPASRQTQGSQSWEHGETPKAAATAWLEQTLRPRP